MTFFKTKMDVDEYVQSINETRLHLLDRYNKLQLTNSLIQQDLNDKVNMTEPKKYDCNTTAFTDATAKPVSNEEWDAFKKSTNFEEYRKALEQIPIPQRDTLQFGTWEPLHLTINRETHPEAYQKAMDVLNTNKYDMSINQGSIQTNNSHEPLSFRTSSQEYPGIQWAMPTITSYIYNGSIYRWIDGDTVEVVLDLGLKIAHRTIVRLYGLNAPEKNTKEGQLLIEHLNLNYPSNSPIIIQTIKDKKEKYGRYLGIIHTTQLSEEVGKIVSKNININDYLLANNFAKILKY